MKIANDQMSLEQICLLKVGDRVNLNWKTAPESIHRIEAVISQITWQNLYIQYFAENNPAWTTAFFWNDFTIDGTCGGDYQWSISAL